MFRKLISIKLSQKYIKVILKDLLSFKVNLILFKMLIRLLYIYISVLN